MSDLNYQARAGAVLARLRAYSREFGKGSRVLAQEIGLPEGSLNHWLAFHHLPRKEALEVLEIYLELAQEPRQAEEFTRRPPPSYANRSASSDAPSPSQPPALATPQLEALVRRVVREELKAALRTLLDSLS